MLKRLERVNVDKLDRRLASVAEALEEADETAWREALAARLAKRAARLEAAIESAGQIYAPEGLHQVRIASKKLRYGLEIVADSRLAAAASHVRTIKRAQEMLGLMHDLQVLQTHVAAVQSGSASAKPSTAQGLAMLARHIEDRCRHLHGRYIVIVPKLRELSAAITESLVPQLTSGRTRRPLKMGLAHRALSPAAQGGR
jgi:CHAD domain-containing protein